MAKASVTIQRWFRAHVVRQGGDEVGRGGMRWDLDGLWPAIYFHFFKKRQLEKYFSHQEKGGKYPLLALPNTSSSPLKMGRAPKGKACLPTINFQGLC